MSKKNFSVVVCDPPWSFHDSLKMSDVARGASSNYSTMTISEIKALPVKDICNPDGAVLCLWVPSSLLQEGLDTMKAWGFKHKQTYIWVKTKKDTSKDIIVNLMKSIELAINSNGKSKKLWKEYITNSIRKSSIKDVLSFNMGRIFRQTHEICLIGVSGKNIYKKIENKSQRSVSFAENLKHSAKPEHLQDSLEIMFPAANYLEMFARRQRQGWVCLGNEVCNGEDIRISLGKLFN